MGNEHWALFCRLRKMPRTLLAKEVELSVLKTTGPFQCDGIHNLPGLFGGSGGSSDL